MLEITGGEIEADSINVVRYPSAAEAPEAGKIPTLDCYRAMVDQCAVPCAGGSDLAGGAFDYARINGGPTIEAIQNLGSANISGGWIRGTVSCYGAGAEKMSLTVLRQKFPPWIVTVP